MKLGELTSVITDGQEVAIVTELGSAGLYRYPSKNDIAPMFLRGNVASVRVNKNNELIIEVR